MRSRTLIITGLLCAALAAGCGNGGNKGECDLAAPDCASGLVCEAHPDGQARCVAPLVIRGRVLDALDDGAVEGALVQAVDVNGAATGTSDQTDSDGRYELTVPVPRDEEGLPAEGTWTLRVQARGYEPFPSALRPALPLDATGASESDHAWMIDNATTIVKLLPLPGGGDGLGSISGTILAEQHAGVLVVAEGGGEGLIGFSDADGVYTIFNVPAGNYTVSGYAAGVQLQPATADVPAGDDVTGIDLDASADPLATVSGNVNIVNAPGGSKTSVVLAVESTFVENAARGIVPPGLRAPEPGTPPDVVGAFEIAGVPNGKYVVLAAFENDGLVRDPDPTIAGTQIVHIEVAGTDVDIPEGFKVTEALEVIGPGALGPDEVTEAPTFEWADDSSEDNYELLVFDAFGDEVWSDLNVPRVTGAPTVTRAYEGPALEPGMVYQFRATSIKAGAPISQTEDLKGVFIYQPGP